MQLTLANKISLAIVGVLTLSLLSSIFAIGSAYRFEATQRTLVAENLESMRAAEELEIALLEQRGFVSSYILDKGNKTWLQKLDKRRQNFNDWLVLARETARSPEEREILDRLEVVQRAYALKRDEVVTLFDSGQEERARQVLLSDVAGRYGEAYDLCEKFIAANEVLVEQTSARVRRQVERITVIATVVLLINIGLSAALLYLFFQGVLFPLRRMALEVRDLAGKAPPGVNDGRSDELPGLGHYVQLLMTDVVETRSDLQHSRTQLAHAEKLAAVGKLAASVAHEIRNPLTAIKMWLFSLRRSIGQDADVQQKFDTVSDEIARLESIIRNFLEFARPPSLHPRPKRVEELLDTTLDLLRYRLEDERLTLERTDEPDLPRVLADAEQMKQVLLNLLNNAIEATPAGGKIEIQCSRSRHGGRDMVGIRVADSGHGIPQDVQRRIFEPFFTTKEGGTGLGLCIAASIMARHDGLLELQSTNEQGTQWNIWIPMADE